MIKLSSTSVTIVIVYYSNKQHFYDLLGWSCNITIYNLDGKMVYAMLQFTILETMPPDDNCRKHVDPAIHTFFFINPGFFHLWKLRKTKTVSMLPVGLVSGSPVSTPIVEDGKYTGFYVGWNGKRKFPLDMAGFAFSVRYYRQVQITFKIDF